MSEVQLFEYFENRKREMEESEVLFKEEEEFIGHDTRLLARNYYNFCCAMYHHNDYEIDWKCINLIERWCPALYSSEKNHMNSSLVNTLSILKLKGDDLEWKIPVLNWLYINMNIKSPVFRWVVLLLYSGGFVYFVYTACINVHKMALLTFIGK